MGVPRRRFVCRTRPDGGWGVWDRLHQRWWGPVLRTCPETIVAYLNAGGRDGDNLNQLIRRHS
jgi:hypothetical protein